MVSSRNCYLCNKPLDDADHHATRIRCIGRTDTGGVYHKRITIGVHDECIKDHNRMLSREAFLRATRRRAQSR